MRRDEFVVTAQRLVQVKGYEQLSVQDILDELGASKGAFYHYFDSKEALLGAVVDRMTDGVTAVLGPIVDDARLPAIEKIGRGFSAIAQWKSERKDLVLAVLRVWLSDDNAIVRVKAGRSMRTRVAPLLAGIVRQGIAEGVFRTGAPEDVARVWVSLIQEMNDELSHLFVARQANEIGLDTVERTLSAYTDALERVLGAPPGSITIVDERTMHEWFG